MANPVNDPISDFELLGRGFYCTSQINEKGKIRRSAFYPMNKRDLKRPDFFTNKLSMFRICHDISALGLPQWDDNVKYACKFERSKRIFKGFGIERAYFFKNLGFGFEPAASEENPYHMHLIIPDYNEPFRKVGSVSELLGEEKRKMLEDIRHKVRYIPCCKEELPTDSPCEICPTTGNISTSNP